MASGNCARCSANAGHRALAAMADHVPQFTLITQNVDDLHERAGSPHVLHLHGELARPYCEACRRSYVFPIRAPKLPPGGARIEPPRCEVCGASVGDSAAWLISPAGEMTDRTVHQ